MLRWCPTPAESSAWGRRSPTTNGHPDDQKQSTSGEQRLFNYACQLISETDFVALVTAGQPPAPGYFIYDAVLNRKVRVVYDPGQPLTASGTAAMLTAIAGGAVVIDARDTQDFASRASRLTPPTLPGIVIPEPARGHRCP